LTILSSRARFECVVSSDLIPFLDQEARRLPPPNDEAGESEAGVRLILGGKAMVLDALGPMVLNEDGSVSRITNWHSYLHIPFLSASRILLSQALRCRPFCPSE